MRHYAFFRQGSGEWIREVLVEVPAAWRSLIHLAHRLQSRWLLNAVARHLSQPQRGEIGLDVTQFNYPLGDFQWATFDDIDRRLSFDRMHYFIEIDLSRMTILANTQSPRPIRPMRPDRLIVDVTGTPAQAQHGRLFGEMALVGDALTLVRPRTALGAARSDLDPFVLAHVRAQEVA